MRYLIIFLILLLLAVSLFAQDTTEILMDGNKSVTAHFKKIQYTLTTSVEPVGSGTVSGAGTYDIGTDVTVEAIPAQDYVFDHWSFGSGKWSGLGMGIFSVDFDNQVDILIANGFTELRVDIPNYQDVAGLALSKTLVLSAVAKGINVIWGVTSNPGDNPDYMITAENWLTFRQAILDAAQWAQDNGVFEFQLGNEEANHVDEETISWTEIPALMRTLATEVQVIFTNGNISYACSNDVIVGWAEQGKGDIDLLASNIYMGGEFSPLGRDWQSEIDALVNAFGVDSTYIAEFAPSYTSLDDYSEDEAVQAAGVTEMIEYIKASGIKRALFFTWYDDDFGVKKWDGTYRQLWNSLLNSE